jgi:hypothetical protein
MAKSKQGIKTEEKLVRKRVRIARVNPDNLKPIFANDFTVSHTDREFFFNFSVLEPLGILDENQLNRMKSINAIATAKIVVTPQFAEAILKALSINIDNYKEGREEDADTNSG